MISEEALSGLQAICPEAQVLVEGGKTYVLLPRLKVTVDGKVRELDALLCPGEHSGYATRLFLSEVLSGKIQNWTPHTILGRLWHTWSWKDIPASLPLPQMLLEHLRAFR